MANAVKEIVDNAKLKRQAKKIRERVNRNYRNGKKQEPPTSSNGIFIDDLSDSDTGYGDFWGNMETYEKKVGKQNFIGGEFVGKKSSDDGIDIYDNRDTEKGAATVNSTEQESLGTIKKMSDSDKEEMDAKYGDLGKQNYTGGEFVGKKSSDLTNDNPNTTTQLPTWGKIAAGVGVVGVGGGLVLNLARSNGSLTNKQLYGQEPLY